MSSRQYKTSLTVSSLNQKHPHLQASSQVSSDNLKFESFNIEKKSPMGSFLYLAISQQSFSTKHVTNLQNTVIYAKIGLVNL